MSAQGVDERMINVHCYYCYQRVFFHFCWTRIAGGMSCSVSLSVHVPRCLNLPHKKCQIKTGRKEEEEEEEEEEETRTKTREQEQ